MRTALEYARTFDVPVAEHCEDMTLAQGGAMNEGLLSAKLGLKGIPSEAEEIFVIRDILLARRTRGRLHLCHMSTRGSVDLIRWGKLQGIPVTAEVCSHHISLTEEEVVGYNTNAKMNPPLRTAEDVAALQEAVRDGTIDILATDHAPHHYDEKEREFPEAPNGIVGLETALGVNIQWLVVPEIITLATLIERMSCAPARIFKLPGGSLKKGGVADVTVFDPSVQWVVDPSEFKHERPKTHSTKRLCIQSYTKSTGNLQMEESMENNRVEFQTRKRANCQKYNQLDHKLDAFGVVMEPI
jgi:dihydroorotase